MAGVRSITVTDGFSARTFASRSTVMCLLWFMLAGAVAQAATARSLEGAERAALAKRVAAFTAATSANDYAAVIDFVPPKALQGVADQSKMELGALKAAMVERLQGVAGQVKVESFSIASEVRDAKFGAGGEPIVLLPTEMILDVTGRGRMRIKTHTLALKDGAEWYLTRVQPAQIQMLVDGYPDLAETAFPSGEVEVLK